ncbi:MAG: helix-turn-helix domain-containing protein [Clostridia bacterium]|nr:helix-turn-helix domain-containing protein [Clostridia bacterium]
MSQDIENIIIRLKNVIVESDLSYVELEKKTGISKSALQRYANGSTKKIPIDVIQAIAAAVNVSAAWIMGWDNDVPEGFLPLPKTKKVPLLGTIACGEPILATENIEMYIKVDESIPADFALKCKGDSMINARIFDGDIVYIRQQPDVEDGEIAAVLIGDEATLKKVHKYPNKIVLSACNPMYDDYVYTNEQLNEIRILGKAVAFFSIIK